MTKLVYIISIFALVLTSCNEDPFVPDMVSQKKDTVQKSINNLRFKLTATSDNEFTFVIPTDEQVSYELFLKKNNKALADNKFVRDTNISSLLTTTVNYNFLPNNSYQILIRATKTAGDTVYLEDFTINSYIHNFVAGLNYEKLTTIKQLLEFDMAPSGNIIFYLDFINNKFVLNKLSLADNSLEQLDGEFFSLLLRAKNDNELIVSTNKIGNRYLGSDSCALLTYNLFSKESSFLDWGSKDYGRFSRVVNNEIMVSNPVSTNSVTLINLSNDFRKTYQTDIRYLREYSYDHIYIYNDILDFASLEFINRLPFLNSNSAIGYYDENSGYFITTEYFTELEPRVTYSRMIIYKDNKIVSELPFEKNRNFSLPRKINLTDNKLIFFQSYEYDSEVRTDGYYLLDISTNKVTLLQNESDNYVKYDFFSGTDKNTFISVRPYKILRVSLK